MENFIELMDLLLNIMMDTKHWYINGERHRTDGPAIEYNDETKALVY